MLVFQPGATPGEEWTCKASETLTRASVRARGSAAVALDVQGKESGECVRCLPLECMLVIVSGSGLLLGGGTGAQTATRLANNEVSQDAVPGTSRSRSAEIALFPHHLQPCACVADSSRIYRRREICDCRLRA